jgi:uncharacterized protein
VTETRRAAEEQAALRRVATLVAHDTAPDALFAGFPGFRSKLWADDVTTGVYRGIYEWDGAEAARAYATRMVGLLAPFSNADTARFHVVGGLRRDTFLRDPQAAPSDGADGWWRTEQPVETSSQRRFPDVALKHRLSDASYRFYDRGRHKAAFEAATKPGTAPDFSSLQGRKYALLVTFRKDGTAVPTPVWFALLDNRHFVARTEERTAKVRRLRSDERARVFPCDPRGKPLGPGVEGRVRVLPAGVECERAEAALDRHYGRTRRIYEKLMADESGMVYLEVVPAAQESDGEHHLP